MTYLEDQEAFQSHDPTSQEILGNLNSRKLVSEHVFDFGCNGDQKILHALPESGDSLGNLLTGGDII